MKYLSLFSGIGGFELGIGDRAECIGYSEIDKYAISIYDRHFKHKNYGDATRIDTRQLSDFDLIVGGFPCQAFSIAGKRKGFDDIRGTLFFEIARICKDKRPGYLVLENVKGLLHHDQGKTFQTILGILTSLGYIVQWQVLNSKDFSVPQNRERVFIIGYLRGYSRPKVFPVGEDGELFNTKDRTDKGQSQTELSSALRLGGLKADNTYIQEPKLLELTKNVSDAQRIYNVGSVGKGISGQVDSPKGLARTLKGLGGGLGAKTGLYMVGTITDKNSQSSRVYATNGNAPTVSSGNRKNSTGQSYSPKITSGMGIRRLTPTECERLQGFPDGWTEGLSDTQRYKCLGNAVTVNVVKYIFDNFL